MHLDYASMKIEKNTHVKFNVQNERVNVLLNYSN